eukprot:m.165888 g.165888  ORF g.165888 m.165888 type:complete len:645 (-) comp31402_c1_seq1:67-2001(-)
MSLKREVAMRSRVSSVHENHHQDSGVGSGGDVVSTIEVLPWPEKIPDFIGLKFLTYSEGYHNPADGPFRGTGLELRRETHCNFQPHPDKENFPDLFQAEYIGETLSVPDNADPEVLKCVGTQFVNERFYKVDRERKALQLLGGRDVPSATTDPYAPAWHKAPINEVVGGWQWHIHPAGDLQHALNANNTVLRCVNFKSGEVLRTGDPTKSMSFYFASTKSHSYKLNSSRKSTIEGFEGADIENSVDNIPVCEDLIPVVDQTEFRLREMEGFFDARNKFWKPGSTEPVPIEYKTEFVSISSVTPHTEKFGAEIRVKMSWPITKLDVADYTAHPHRELWVPASFQAPMFEITNRVTGHMSDFVVERSPTRLRIRKDRTVMATRTMRAVGDFHENFELVSYPFDAQPVKVVLTTTSSFPKLAATFATANRANDFNTDSLPDVRDTEWYARCVGNHLRFLPEPSAEDDTSRASSSIESTNPEGRAEIVLECVVQRHYEVHMYRVVMVMGFLSLMAIAALCKDPEITCMDRLGMLVTLLLAACTYSLVVGHSLPPLGYLTLLDKYVLGVFAYIGLLSAEVTILEWLDVEEDMERWFTFGNIGLWLLMHLFGLFVVVVIVFPRERIKVKRLLRKNQDLELTRQPKSAVAI